jgi:hypothetical protein
VHPKPRAERQEIAARKHDAFRVIASKQAGEALQPARLDRRFPLIVEAVAKLRASSCIIDGEAVTCRAPARRDQRRRYLRQRTAQGASALFIHCIP